MNSRNNIKFTRPSSAGLKIERRPIVFENWMMRNVFGPKRDGNGTERNLTVRDFMI